MGRMNDLSLQRLADFDFEADAPRLAELTREPRLLFQPQWDKWARMGLTVGDIVRKDRA